MFDTKTAKPLSIENENEKFSCKVFTQIHFAPPVEENKLVYGPMLDNLYVIKHAGRSIFVKLVHYERMPFIHLENVHTLACSGMMFLDWKKKFMELYPKTDHKTMMAIYCYERIEV